MTRIRFHIGTILFVILVSGVGLAALKEASDVWQQGVFTATVAALLISLLLALHRTGSKRAFWTGFALFGWAYLALSAIPSLESRLVTTRLLAFLYPKLPGELHSGISSLGFSHWTYQAIVEGDTTIVTGSVPQSVFPVRPRGSREDFLRIGHALLALIAALMGGRLSLWLAQRKKSD
jgi:hypothetical protein